MKRKLRIACSAVSAITCVLLIALWVRSYWFHDWVIGRPTQDSGFGSSSWQGRVSFVWITSSKELLHVRWRYTALPAETYAEKMRHAQEPGDPKNAPLLGFSYINLPNFGWTVSLPHGYLVAIAAILATVFSNRQRCRVNFSLRTLLVATTLVAVLLGAAVYVVK